MSLCRIRINSSKILALIWHAVLALLILKTYSQLRTNTSYAADTRKISSLTDIVSSSRAVTIGLHYIVAGLVLEITCSVCRWHCCSTFRNHIAVYRKIGNFVGFRCLFVSYYALNAILSDTGYCYSSITEVQGVLRYDAVSIGMWLAVMTSLFQESWIFSICVRSLLTQCKK